MAVAFATGTWMALPSARHLVDMGWACLIGAVGGLYSSVQCCVIWIKNRFPEWFARNYCRTVAHFDGDGYRLGILDSVFGL